MKKGIIIVFSVFLCVMVLGLLGAETGEIHSETETMKEVGKIFASSEKEDMNTDIYAIGKSGGVITKEEINMTTDFYIAVGFDEEQAKDKAIDYMLKREALYQKAMAEGYGVSDSEIWNYIERLKEVLDNSTNTKDVYALMSQFESEEEYWQFEYKVYQKNLPIEKYLEDLRKRFYDSNIETYQISSELSIDEQYEEYIESLKEDLAIKEDFQILEKRGQE